MIVSCCLIAVVSLSAASEEPDLSSYICGPRCAQYVLKWFGTDVDLTELIAEIQGASIDRSADLGQVKAALVNHGVYVRAVKISPSAIGSLEWPGPLIVHYTATDKSAGHFVVIHPEKSDTAKLCVWDGLFGASLRPASEVAASASGVILLVSSHPISDETPLLIKRSGFSSVPPSIWIGALLTLTALMSFARVAPRSWFPRPFRCYRTQNCFDGCILDGTTYYCLVLAGNEWGSYGDYHTPTTANQNDPCPE